MNRKGAAFVSAQGSYTGDTMLKTLKLGAASLTALMTQSALTAAAEVTYDERGLVYENGAVTVQARGAVAVQGAWYEPVQGGVPRNGSEADGSAVLIAEWETSSGLLFGVRGEVDTGNTQIDDFERDELYAYVAADWGRIEVGENDGPADTLSFHAPTIGLGQVRGDFARYTGSVALLSAYDSRDALKVSYFSPPVNGFSAGVSYSPEFTSNEDAVNPTSRIVQDEVYELGAQYMRPVGNWVAAFSGAYVKGTADPVTNRADIESWSLGTELRRGKMVLGGAYVDRGRSALRPTAETENEWNAGLGWEEDRWEAAASYAVTSQGDEKDHRFGIGVDYDVTPHVYLRADAVRLVSERPGIDNRDGWVAMTELGLRF
jgi:Gram-negative porin